MYSRGIVCTLYTIHCTVYNVYCTVYIIHSNLRVQYLEPIYTVQCMYNICVCIIYVQCTVQYMCTQYTVHCTVSRAHVQCTYVCITVYVSRMRCIVYVYSIRQFLASSQCFKRLTRVLLRIASVLLRLLDSSIMLTSYERRASVLLRIATNCQRLASVLLRLLDSSIMLTSYQRRASVLLRIASVFPASCYDYQILAPCLRLTSVLLASCQHLATNCQQLAHVSCPQAVINNNFSYSLTCSRCI